MFIPRLIKRLVTRDVFIILAFLCLTITMIWPLAAPGPVSVPTSDDSYFSIWRLAWIAHQIVRNPAELFNANVFYPATDTLAYSDAMLLVGIVAAPFFWIGLEPAVIHNGLLTAAFASSMWTAYLLAFRLTHDRWAACLAAIIFGFAPFRFAHIGHLELQWVMWMPLSLLILHSLFDSPKASAAIALGVTVAAQTLSSIYYGVFLTTYLLVAWCGLAISYPHRRRVARVSLLAIVPLLVVIAVYGPPYARSRAAYGPRSGMEIAQFSAVASDFLRVPPENRLRGVRDGSPAADERSLFPGGIAILLALAALWPPVSKTTWLYFCLAVFSIDACLGSNGFFFPWLQYFIPPVTSLRSPARFGILLVLSLSVLAALTMSRVNRRFAGRAWPATMICALLCLGEYWSAPLPVRLFQTEVPEAHQWLATQPPGTVVLELPVPRINALWLYETTYQLRSIHHWQRLINGYSGFVPDDYARTLELLASFPDGPSMRRLLELSVDVVLVNRDYYSDEAYEALVKSLLSLNEFDAPRMFGTGKSQILALELRK